ncbi:hypothetical protein [Vibrio splendidus]|uniref:hypothetical protein n=1 Tax=Vibrio splendidus TaxID=29497 RepID=UPI00352D358B
MPIGLNPVQTTNVTNTSTHTKSPYELKVQPDKAKLLQDIAPTGPTLKQPTTGEKTAITISMDEAMTAMTAMNKEQAKGGFTLDDGRQFEIRDMHVIRQNKGSLISRMKEGFIKALHGQGASSSDAKKLTAALHQKADNPAVQENFVRSWDSGGFTEPTVVSGEMGVRGHQSKQDFQFIVHTAPITHLMEGKGVFSIDAESALTSWDVACTSIVNQSKTFTYGSVGVILKVPEQNVIAASPNDLMSETNIGLLDRTEDLVNVSDKNATKTRYEAMPDYERTGLLAKKELPRHQRHTNTPSEVLKKTYGMRNEILICTSGGVNLHEGQKATEKVEIAGFFLNDSAPTASHQDLADWKGETLLSKNDKYELFKQHAEPLAQKLGVPIIYLNGTADIAEVLK